MLGKGHGHQSAHTRFFENKSDASISQLVTEEQKAEVQLGWNSSGAESFSEEQVECAGGIVRVNEDGDLAGNGDDGSRGSVQKG